MVNQPANKESKKWFLKNHLEGGGVAQVVDCLP
jgi:hypothetical protein